jgi:hypothetical protein
MCSLRFDIEENTIIEAFVRFRFASVAITSPYTAITKLLIFSLGIVYLYFLGGEGREAKLLPW